MKIEQVENLHWRCKDKLTPIKNLPTSYLINIRNTVKRYPKKYAGLDSDYWADSIKYLIDFRRISRQVTKDIRSI